MARKRLPISRTSVTHRVAILDAVGGRYKLYIIVGLYPQSERSLKRGEKPKPGELFLYMGKVGSPMRGLLDVFGLQTSLLLQSGVSLESLCDKMEGTRFEPFGSTDNPDIPNCSSIADYIFKWMRREFL